MVRSAVRVATLGTVATTRSDAPLDPPDVGESPPIRRGPWWWTSRALAATAITASFAIWVYAYSGLADRPTPDLLDDPAFAAAAEPVCAAAVADVDAMPGALDALDGADRAAQVRSSTDRFAAMVDDLEALVGGTARDEQILTDWLADWRVLLDDRYRYADEVAVDGNARYYQSDLGVNERLDRRLTRLATINGMPSCSTPTDVG